MRSVLALAFGLTFLVAATGNAAIYTLTPNAPAINWSDPAQWNNGSGTTYPGESSGDVVTVSLNGVTLTVDVSLPNPVQLNISGSGTLSAASALTLHGSSTWGGGTISGAGGLTIPSGAAMSLNGSGAVLSGTTLTNNGTITLNSSSANALQLANAAKISNNGTVDVQSDGAITSDASATTFANNMNATLRKSAGTGTATISGSFVSLGVVLANTGTLAFPDFTQFAPGSTQLNGGSLKGSTLWFKGGKLLGGGTIDANVVLVTATLEPGRGVAPATLNITGYLQQDSGVLIVDCFANGITDRYVIGGDTFFQTIRLLWIGSYDPADGDRFDDVLTGSNFSQNTSFNYFPFGYNNTGIIRRTIGPTSVSFYTVIPTDDLAISETVGGSVPPATTYPVTVTLRNLGAPYASGIHVTVSTDNGSIVSTSSSTFSCSGSGVSTLCTAPQFAMAPDATATITVNVNVPSGSAAVTSTITGNDIDPNTANNTATVTVPPTAIADLGLTLSDSPDPVNAGQRVTYTYTVTNGGPAASTATLSTTIANGSIGGVGAGCVQNTSTIATCTSTSIASGGSATFTITAMPPTIGSITAVGTVTPPAGVGDPNLVNNSASQTTTVIPLADLSITTDAPVTAVPGGTITYTFNVANLGPSEAGIILDDSPPAGITFVKVTDGPCYAFPCNVGSLVSGTKRTITAVYNVAANLAGIVGNTATVSSFIGDPVPGNNTSHVSTTITTSPGCTTGTPDAPVPAVVTSVLSGETYQVQWPAVDGASLYEIEEARDANFTIPSTQTVTTTVVSFAHGTLVATLPFYYRVRAFSACSQQFSGYSQTLYVMVAPAVKRRAVRP